MERSSRISDEKRTEFFLLCFVVNLDLLCTLVLLICDVYIRTGDGYVASKIFKLIEIESDPTVDVGNCRLDFRRSLVSGLPTMHSGEERGLISRKAAGNRAYQFPSCLDEGMLTRKK